VRRSLNLRAVLDPDEDGAAQAAREGGTHAQCLRPLAQIERADRTTRRVERLRRASRRPGEKTRATLERARWPAKLTTPRSALARGAFVDRGENVLAFGRPGRGTTPRLCALGHALIERGDAVRFAPAHRRVPRLLAAKRALRVERALRSLDPFDAVLRDDLGSVPPSREEMEVRFPFVAERSERRSVRISRNWVFSPWDKIFKDPMTTAAAIDRLVHHAVILEMTGPSPRTGKHTQEGGQGGTSIQADSVNP
jgi:DNA replication protein DnaC